MANIFDRIRLAMVGDSVNDVIEKKVIEQLEKTKSTNALFFNPSENNNGKGVRSKKHLLGVSDSTLRDLADTYPVARACVEFRKTQITHLDWNVAPIEITDETVQDKTNIKNSKEVKKFFRYPTGKKDSSFTNWLKQILEDLIVIDSVAIYKRKNRAEDIIGYLPIDGATIRVILEKDGTLPEPPKKAYVQKINGKEKKRFSTDQLIYANMNPRTHDAYGFAPLESLVVTVSTALKLQAYSIGTLTEGNVPEGFVTLPREIASSRDQLKEWQDAWDAMLSGDPRFQKKLKFLPEGMTYEATKKAEDLSFDRFEKWLLQVTCAAFGLHPSAIGFNFDVNRSTAETNFEVIRERGLFPTALFIKEIMDRIIQDDLGYDSLQFNWTNINPTNKLEEAKVVTSLVNGGLLGIDEWRLGEGLKPIGVKDPFILTPVGPIFVKDLLEQSEQGQQPVAPYKPTTAGKPTGGTRNLPIDSRAKVDYDEYLDELLKWRKVATNDLASNERRDFKTDVLDKRTQDMIKMGLKRAKNRQAVKNVFKPFMERENYNSNALLGLYDGINDIINKKSDTL